MDDQMNQPTPPNTVNTPDALEAEVEILKKLWLDHGVGRLSGRIGSLFEIISTLQYLNKTLQETNVSLQELAKEEMKENAKLKLAMDAALNRVSKQVDAALSASEKEES